MRYCRMKAGRTSDEGSLEIALAVGLELLDKTSQIRWKST